MLNHNCIDYITGVGNVIQAPGGGGGAVAIEPIIFNGQLLGSWSLKMANF